MPLPNRGIFAGYDGTQKPPAGWELDPDHPLVSGLRVAFCPDHAGGQYDLLGNRFDPVLFSGAISVIPGYSGTAIKYAAGATTSYHANTTVALPTTACTVLLLANPVNATGSTFGNHDSTSDPATRVQAHIPESGSVKLDFGGFSGANRLSWTPAAGWFGQWHAMAFRAGMSGSSIWSDGVRQANQTTAITRTAETTPGFDVGRFVSSGSFSNQGPVESLWLLGRELSDAEIVAWSAAPYAHLIPPAPRRTVFVPSGTTFNVTASGGIVLGGSALPPSITWSPSGSGGLVLGGSAPPAPTWSPAPSGGIVLGGSVVASPTFAPVPSGTVTLGGTAPGSTGGTSGGTSARSGRGPIWHGFTGEQKPPGGWEVDPNSAGNVLAFWPLNEGAGRLAADVAKGNNGTLTNFASSASSGWIVGKNGPAIRFDGVDDFVAASSLSPSLTGLTAVSISWWLDRTAGGTAALGQGQQPNRFGILWFTDNRIYLVADDGVTASAPSVAATATGRVHVCAVFDGSLSGVARWTLYVNGIAFGVAGSGTPAAAVVAPASGFEFSLGRIQSSGSYLWQDQPTESVAIVGRALRPAEVAEAYSRPYGSLVPPASRAPAGGPQGPTFPGSASGGIVFGGTVTATPTWSPAPVGGIVLGGTVTVTPTWSPVPVGGIILGGTATRSFTLIATASGGIVLGGTLTPGTTFAPTATGTIVLSGLASATGAGQFNATASGGIVLGGTAAGIIGFSRIAAGGVFAGGTATWTIGFGGTSTGGVTLGGVVVPGLAFVATVSGGIVLGGVATVQAFGLGVGPSHFRSTVMAPLDPYRSTGVPD